MPDVGPRLSWMIVAHPRALDVAAAVLLDLDAAGLLMKLEASDAGFRGFSHREWGDATNALAFLVETSNPNQATGALAVEPRIDLSLGPGLDLARPGATRFSELLHP